MTARLTVEAAGVCFGSTRALDAIDLSVAAGEVLVVFGPSGSGKSTLLRAIAGLQPLASGRIVLDGVDVSTWPAHRRGVGLMFQDHALFPHLDVGDNVAFGLRMQGVAPSTRDARVEELLDLVGLPGVARRPIQTLSGGEQQRVALARALAPDPRVLLLDEPLASLDRPLRLRLRGELREVFDRVGITVVAVTHDRAEALALGDRLAIVDGGRLLQTDPPEAVWARPSSRRVADLLGFTNLITACTDAGRLHTAWGDLGPADGRGTDVLVRPEGVALDPEGPIEATVRDATFAGAYVRVRYAIAGAPDLVAHLADGAIPERGAPARLRIDPRSITVVGG